MLNLFKLNLVDPDLIHYQYFTANRAGTIASTAQIHQTVERRSEEEEVEEGGGEALALASRVEAVINSLVICLLPYYI
jgi:hypothetical protein